MSRTTCIARVRLMKLDAALLDILACPVDHSPLRADEAGLEAGDPGSMLPAVASAAAQVREAAVLAAEAGVARLADDGRPRAVVVCGMGGSGIAGDVLSAVAGDASPVPVVVSRGPV